MVGGLQGSKGLAEILQAEDAPAEKGHGKDKLSSTKNTGFKRFNLK